QGRGVAPGESACARFMGEPLRQPGFGESDQGAGLHGLTFVGREPHHVDVPLDRFVEGYARREHRNEVEGLFRVRVEEVLGRARDSQLDASYPLGWESL